MAITTEFPGSSLPSGWSFHSAQSVGSVDVSGGKANITIPVGSSSYDTITNSNGAENSIGIQHAVSAGDLDIAIQIDTDLGDSRGWSVNLLVHDGANGKVRWAIYKTGTSSPSIVNMNAQAPSFYMASRTAAGTNGPSAYNVATNGGAFNNLMTGMPSWLRITYNSSTGLWTGYYSTDGWNWLTPPGTNPSGASVTQSFTPAVFKIGIASVAGSAGGTIGIGQVVDVAAAGTTDLRGVVQTRVRVPVVTINGTDGSLPSSFVDDSDGATSGLSWTGTALRFTDDPTLDAARSGWARIRYTGTTYSECGVLMRLQNTTGNANCYGTVGLVGDHADQSIYSVAASGATRTNSTDAVVATVSAGHGFFVNQLIVASDFADSNFNGQFKVVATTATTITWISTIASDASTGAGTITVASRSPIDQYVRAGGYGLEIHSGTDRRPIRVDDPAGTNVGSGLNGSGTANTDLDEMPYFWMKDLDDYNMTGGAIRMFRLERIGRRYRVKEWADAGSLAASLAAEPSTWNHIDAQDEVITSALGPAFSLSHNGVRTGPNCIMDMLYLQYYSIEPAAKVKAGGTFSDAQTIKVKQSGAWVDATTARRKSGGAWV